MKHKGMFALLVIAIVMAAVGVYMVSYDVLGISALYETSKVIVVIVPIFILAIVAGIMIVRNSHKTPEINQKVRTSLNVELNQPHEEIKLFVKPVPKPKAVKKAKKTPKKPVKRKSNRPVSMRAYSKDSHEVLSERINRIDKVLSGLKE